MGQVPKFEIRQVKEFSDVNGVQRAPSILEDNKNPYWDNSSGRFKYRDDIHIVSAEREDASNRAELTLSDGTKVYLDLGLNAWSNDDILASAVTSVFGRVGDVISNTGDYDASQVTNAFNVSLDTLDDILEGTTNKHLTTVLKANYDYAYSVAHTHSNKATLDLISDAGSGMIVTDAERTLWNSYAANSVEFIQDTVADLMQDTTTVSWTYNDIANTLSASINFTEFDSDSINEGDTNLFYSDEKVYSSLSVSQTTGLGTLSFDNINGIFNYVPPTSGQVRSLISASYPIAYDPSSGIVSWSGGTWGGGGSGTASFTVDIAQIGHGFSIADAIRLDKDTGEYVKASADDDIQAQVIGIVVAVADANAFTYQYAGLWELNPNPYTEGVALFLSPTTAGLIEEEPIYEIGQVRSHIGMPISEGVLINLDLGDIVGGGELEDIPAGSVEAVAAGDGMDFTTFTVTGYVTLGTPTQITSTSIDEVTTDSHTHSLDDTGVVADTYDEYTSFTVDAKGRITNAIAGTAPTLAVYVEDSITGAGSLADPFHLDGDVPSPGPYHVYGTNVSGVRGWYEVASTDGHIEDILFEFRDIEAGTPQEYILDIAASFTYDVLSVVLQSDGTLQGVYVDIDGLDITGLDSVTATTSIVETAATGSNSVMAGSKLTITTTSSFTGTPTLLRGKIKYRRT